MKVHGLVMFKRRQRYEGIRTENTFMHMYIRAVQNYIKIYRNSLPRYGHHQNSYIRSQMHKTKVYVGISIYSLPKTISLRPPFLSVSPPVKLYIYIYDMH